MTSAQKQNRKSAKFNYLATNSMKQQLLGRYETLNFQPSIYRRNYDPTLIEKNKQNIKENINQDFIDESKYLTKNESKQLEQKTGSIGSSNHRLISFRKNRPQQKNVKLQKNKKDSMILDKSDKSKDYKQKNCIQNVQRVRNKSFGNISLKKSQLDNNRQKSHKKNGVQFSPYQEQKKSKQLFIQDCSNRFKSIDLQRLQHGSNSRPQQKLLIYELQEQQLIIKKQLKQFEYQNQLLRKKIQYLEDQNFTLKETNEKYKEEVQSQQIYYQQLLDTQSLNITQLHQQLQTQKIKVNQYETIINQDKFFIKDLQSEIEILNSHVKELEMILDSKQQIILQLKNKIQLIPSNQRQSQFVEKNLSKRRKSLDLSTQIKRSPINDYLNQSNLNSKNYLSSGQESSEYRTTLNTSKTAKLMNKTSNLTLNTIQQNKFIEKQINFIESIKSMYLKITNKQTKDLKQLWKWLKFIAHQYQSFTQLYTFKDSIKSLLDNFQTKNLQQQHQKQLPFTEKECYTIFKKLSQILIKSHN